MSRVACGGSSTRSKRLRAFPTGVGGTATGGEGAILHTSDGRQLIDWVGSLGATPLGYGNYLLDGVVSRIMSGAGSPIFSFPHEYEEQTAELLCEALAWPEAIKFTKTGSEACAGAIRIARSATKRNKVAVFRGHYHGWHDWHAVSNQNHPGIPDGLAEDLMVCDTSSIPDLTGCAAVILEPATRWWVPESSWLEELKTEAARAGSLVIFDEMILGARVALGGGGELFGVQPDLAVYGKAFAGGFPLAFIAGSDDLMRHAEYVSGTYSGEILSLTACAVVLDIYESEPIVARLHRHGASLRRVFVSHGIQTTGLDPFFAVSMSEDPEDHRRRMSIFVQQCAHRGVLFHPSYIASCAAMTATELHQSTEVVGQVLEDINNELYELEGEEYDSSIRD